VKDEKNTEDITSLEAIKKPNKKDGKDENDFIDVSDKAFWGEIDSLSKIIESIFQKDFDSEATSQIKDDHANKLMAVVLQSTYLNLSRLPTLMSYVKKVEEVDFGFEEVPEDKEERYIKMVSAQKTINEILENARRFLAQNKFKSLEVGETSNSAMLVNLVKMLPEEKLLMLVNKLKRGMSIDEETI
jgi:hypothetical protein